MDNLIFPEDQARRLVIALVKRLYPTMFLGFREKYCRDDLVQEGLTAALTQWPRYDPTRSAPSTFITQRAKGRIIDLIRRANREAKRDHAACELNPEVQEIDVAPADPFEWEQDVPLVDWLRGVYIASRSFYTRAPRKRRDRQPHRRGRRFFNAAQLQALGALALRLKLSSRACRHVLAERPDLRKAIRIERLPSHQYLSRVIRAARIFRDANYPHLLAQSPKEKMAELLAEKKNRQDFFVPARRAG